MIRCRPNVEAAFGGREDLGGFKAAEAFPSSSHIGGRQRYEFLQILPLERLGFDRKALIGAQVIGPDDVRR